jgi:hypothetical protein
MVRKDSGLIQVSVKRQGEVLEGWGNERIERPRPIERGLAMLDLDKCSIFGNDGNDCEYVYKYVCMLYT